MLIIVFRSISCCLLSVVSTPLKDGPFSTEDAKLIAECLLLPSSSPLKSLLLTGGQIGDEGIIEIIKALSHSSCQVGLTEFSIANNEITERTIHYLCDLVAKPTCTLTILNLNVNEIGDKSVTALSKALYHNTSLKTLWLGECEVSYEGGQSLITLLSHNSTLEKIRIGYENHLSPPMRNRIETLSQNSDREISQTPPSPYVPYFSSTTETPIFPKTEAQSNNNNEEV